MGISEKLKEMGLTLPGVAAPAGNYVPAVRADSLIFTSGQVPKIDGKLAYAGKVGGGVSEEDGYAAARICALNCLSAIDYIAGGLDNVERIVKATCFINSAPDFVNQANVANGATDLLGELFGKSGTPSRSAVGAAALPGNAAVEVELVAQIKDVSRCREF